MEIDVNDALIKLGEQDSVMKELIDKHKKVTLKGNYMESEGLFFADLVRSISGHWTT